MVYSIHFAKRGLIDSSLLGFALVLLTKSVLFSYGIVLMLHTLLALRGVHHLVFLQFVFFILHPHFFV